MPAPRAALVLALVLPVFAWAPLTYPGYFELHSGFLPIFNLNDLLGRGFDPGWRPTLGTTYDLLRGDGPLAYWLAAAIRMTGVSSLFAVKLVFGLSLVAASLGVYAWARQTLGEWPALVAATAYTLSPVLLATVFVRGAFAEAVLLGLVPWVICSARAAVQGSPPARWPAVVALALTLAAAVLVLPGLGLWLGLLVLAYVLSGWTPARGAALLGWLTALLLAVAGLLPAALRHGPGGGSGEAFIEHLVYPHQLLSQWGTGPSVAGPADTLTFNLGFAALGLAVIGVVLGRAARSVSPGAATGRTRPGPWLPLALTLVLVFLSTTLARPVWQAAPFLAASLTYPWQLLLLALPWLAWLAGAGARQVLSPEVQRNVTDRVPMAAAMLVLVLLPSYADQRPVTSAPPPGAAPLAIYGENQVALLSVTPEGDARPGGQIAVEVRWQALRPLGRDYTVFFHVIGADGLRYGQQDTTPGGGSSPTSSWRPGQVVADRYTVTLPPDVPAGPYEYWLGLYDLQSGGRLPTATGDKYVLRVNAAGGAP